MTDNSQCETNNREGNTPIELYESSGNVFADLDLENADELLEHRFSIQEQSLIERETVVWGVWGVCGESR